MLSAVMPAKLVPARRGAGIQYAAPVVVSSVPFTDAGVYWIVRMRGR
jgi:hypothetical protein